MRGIALVLAGLLMGGVALADSKDHPGRLVIADGRSNVLRVLDLEKGTLVGSFSTPGIANVYDVPDSSYVFAIHRDANRVSLVFSGLALENHGDHDDLLVKAPYIAATFNTGPQPTHFFAHGKDILIFNDGDGTIAWMNQDKLGLSLDFNQIATGAPDHGAPAVLDGLLLSGSLNNGTIDVYNPEGRKLQSVAGCPRLHGEAVWGNYALFGCQDGVMLTERFGVGISSRKIANPTGWPANARVGTVVSHEKSPYFIGNFGQGLVWVNPKEASMTPLALPAAPVRFGFDHDGLLVVLTADGNLHTLSVAERKVVASLSVVPPVTTGGEGAVRPALALGEGKAYVSNPANGEIVEVDLSSMKVLRKFAVGGAPASLALIKLEGVRH